MPWNKTIRDAIKCGPVPKYRSLDGILRNPKTRGEMVVAFAAEYLVVPEGMLVGKPLLLDPFQIAFILAVLDNPHGTRHAYLSIARRNGKTFLVAVILLAYIIGPLAKENTQISSGALSRDQAALAFKLMQKILMLSPGLETLHRIIPSSKTIVGLNKNVTYHALSADAKTGHGQSLYVILLDEAGQIVGPSTPFTDMLTSSQGSYDDSLMLTISTQAPSDADFLSIQLDHAERSQDKHTVSHVYAADPDADLMSKRQWKKANPGLGRFRSLSDLEEQLKTAKAIPAKEPGARNLLLNQRVSQESLFLSPNVWKRGNGNVDLDIFRKGVVSAGLDLSNRHDLTACILSAKDDDGNVHLLPYVFCPSAGIEERSRRDRVPYNVWVEQGYLIPLGGETMDYDQIAEYMRVELEEKGIVVSTVEFDRWRVRDFKAACEREKAFSLAEWHEVGQGYKDFSPRCESFLNAMLNGHVRHAKHPLLNMAASNAISVKDPTGAIKLDKSKSTQRIDPLVAAVMSTYPLLDGKGEDVSDVSHWIG